MALQDLTAAGLHPGPVALAVMRTGEVVAFAERFGKDLAVTHLRWREQPALRDAPAEAAFRERNLFERIAYHERMR